MSIDRATETNEDEPKPLSDNDHGPLESGLINMLSISTITAITLSFLVSSSAIWSIGYWMYFGLNPFQLSPFNALGSGAGSAFIILVFFATVLIISPLVLRHTKFSSFYEMLSELRELQKERVQLQKKIKSGISAEELKQENLRLEKIAEESGDEKALEVIKELGKKLTKTTERERSNHENMDKLIEQTASTDQSVNRLFRQFLFWTLLYLLLSIIASCFFYQQMVIPLFLYSSIIFFALLAVLVDYYLLRLKGFSTSKSRFLTFIFNMFCGTLFISFLSGGLQAKIVTTKDEMSWVSMNHENEPRVFLGILGEWLVVKDKCTSEISLKNIAHIEEFSLIDKSGDIECKS